MDARIWWDKRPNDLNDRRRMDEGKVPMKPYALTRSGQVDDLSAPGRRRAVTKYRDARSNCASESQLDICSAERNGLVEHLTTRYWRLVVQLFARLHDKPLIPRVGPCVIARGSTCWSSCARHR